MKATRLARRMAMAACLVSALAHADEPPAATSQPAATSPAATSQPAATSPPPPAVPASGEAARDERQLDAIVRRLEAAEWKLARQGAELSELRRALAEARGQSGAAFRLGGLSVSLSGFVQADGVLYHQASVDELDPSTGQPLNETRFLIRRARLRVSADYGIAAGHLELDGNTVNGPTARVTSAEVSVKWRNREAGAPPWLEGLLGLSRIPFGYEVQERDYERLFLERSNVIRALFPGEYDLGVTLRGGFRWLRWQVAAMNGHPSGDQQFAARDPSQSKDFLGRLGLDTALGAPGRARLSGGLSGLWGTGFHAGTPATKDQLVWHDLDNDGQVAPIELTAIPGQPSTPSETFQRWAFGADLRGVIAIPRLGPLALYGELVFAQNLDRALVPADPVAVGRSLRELGWYVGFTQQLGKYAAVGLRYDRYDPDEDARDRVAAELVPRDRSYSTFSTVVAGMWPPVLRVSLEWDHNTNALGRSASGAPATLGANVVTLRAQLGF